MAVIKLALAKGRLQEEAIKVLMKRGLDCQCLLEKNRKLIFDIPNSCLQIILLKAVDVPTYVEHGVVDMGIVGKDVVLEQEKQLYEVADLGFGKCRISVAGKPELMNYNKKHLRVATKYPNITKQYFAEKGQSVEIIKQEGSVELAPIMGLSDVIVDIVETGNTLRDNGLVILEEIMSISARLVSNKVSIKTKKDKMNEIIYLIANDIG